MHMVSFTGVNHGLSPPLCKIYFAIDAYGCSIPFRPRYPRRKQDVRSYWGGSLIAYIYHDQSVILAAQKYFVSEQSKEPFHSNVPLSLHRSISLLLHHGYSTDSYNPRHSILRRAQPLRWHQSCWRRLHFVVCIDSSSQRGTRWLRQLLHIPYACSSWRPNTHFCLWNCQHPPIDTPIRSPRSLEWCHSLPNSSSSFAYDTQFHGAYQSASVRRQSPNLSLSSGWKLDLEYRSSWM
jgi:hypothetical protein